MESPRTLMRLTHCQWCKNPISPVSGLFHYCSESCRKDRNNAYRKHRYKTNKVYRERLKRDKAKTYRKNISYYREYGKRYYFLQKEKKKGEKI